ncbi:TonB-dependent receptor [Paucibacter sp. KBW04]|uniref:TonB-dependent receptor n=1 Tax=Paucibacter sp. KBW04 TaxID=2153361 RepID=UPI000F561BFF|nr:TonB-dependent receptor [Paucibacter sp. KBW04]
MQSSFPSQARPLTVALLALSAACASSMAWAQASSPEPAKPATEEGAAKLETVVVSAQRRLERLQDVPVAVKAFSSKQIESMGIKSTQDFINLTPNMSFDNSFTYGNSFVVLRGVTQINNADSPVAVVIDGVPQNDQKQLKMSLFDIERIEVLKGPQGALYGRNAIGGAINIETKAPSDKFEGFVGLGLGNGKTRELTGGISGALKEGVALYRLVGQSKRGDGLIQNTFLNQPLDAIDKDDSLRARLLLRPSESVQIDLRASATDLRGPATWDSIVQSKNPADIVAPKENMLGKTWGSTRDFSAKVEADLALGTLSSITSRTKLVENYRGDIDFSNPVDLPKGFLGLGFQAGQGQNRSVQLTSQELRLTSPADQPLRWIAGLYYLDTRKDLETRVFVDTDGSNDQFDDTSKVIVNLSERSHNKASALFGQLDYDFNPALTLSTALRYDRDQREQQDLIGGGMREASYSKWQPKLTLTRKLGRDDLVYGTLSTGFRSGGFNAPGLASFRPESLSNAELGSKMVGLDGRLLFNVAAFASQSKDFQYFYVDIKSGSQVIANLDKVNIRGLDMDFRYLPFKGLELDGGLGMTHSIIAKDSINAANEGKHTPKNVPFKLNLGLQYSQALGAGLMGSMRLDYEHRDQKYWHPDNAAVSPALDLLGLRLSLRDARDRWSLTLEGKNLADKRYYADYNSAAYSGLPYDLGSLASGRTYGLELKYRFD